MKNAVKKVLALAAAAVMLAGGAVPAYADAADTSCFAASRMQIGVLQKPVIVKTQRSSCAVNLKWKKISKATGYKVYMKTASGWKCKKVIKGGSIKSFKVQNLDSNTRYTFKVMAYKKTKGKTYYSKYSAPVTVTTKMGIGRKNYTSKYYSFRFSPTVWEIMDLEDTMALFCNKTASFPEGAFEMSITRSSMSEETKGMTTDEYAQYIIDSQDEDDPPAVMGDVRVIDGYSFRMVNFDNSEQEGEAADMEDSLCVLVKDDKKFVIAFSAEKKYHAAAQKQFSKVLDTMDII